MKFLIRCLAVALLLTSRAWAQPVMIEVDAPQDVFLPGETILLHVHIKNASGRRLHLGGDPGWLNISITSRMHKQAPRLRPLDVDGEMDLESGFTAMRKVEITPSLDLLELGSYAARATVRLREFGAELTSTNAFKFDITRGFRLWEQEFGVPPREGEPPGTVPESRRFSLVQLRTAKYITLYYRVSDAADMLPLKVESLGQHVAFAAPEAQLDRFSNLHVLFQSYRRSFMHCIISPDGELMGRSTYDFGISRPILKLDEKDRVVVSGGLRLVATNDLPPFDPRMLPKPLPRVASSAEPTAKESTKKNSAKKAAVVTKSKK